MTEKPRFSPFTTICLTKAGWFPGRKVDCSSMRKVLEETGILLHEKGHNFLTEFGELRLIFPHPKVLGIDDSCSFDIFEAIDKFDPMWAKGNYMARVNSPLCIIGHASRAHLLLTMSPDGAVYGGFDDILLVVGSSGEDAIEALCSGRELQEVE